MLKKSLTVTLMAAALITAFAVHDVAADWSWSSANAIVSEGQLQVDDDGWVTLKLWGRNFGPSDPQQEIFISNGAFLYSLPVDEWTDEWAVGSGFVPTPIDPGHAYLGVLKPWDKPFASIAITWGTTGPPGPPGADGEDGWNGIDGQDGVDGQDGADGQDGVNGEDGADGQDGADGINGTNGVDGQDGTDGQPGPPGDTRWKLGFNDAIYFGDDNGDGNDANIGVGIADPQSGMQFYGAYLQHNTRNSVNEQPPVEDCDKMLWRGRMAFDLWSDSLWTCTLTGWRELAYADE